MKKLRPRFVLTLSLIAIASSVAIAGHKIKGPIGPLILPGLDRDGNLDFALGGLTVSKGYKYTSGSKSGLIVNKHKATVGNLSVAKSEIRDAGCPVFDPENNMGVGTATSDKTQYSTPKEELSKAHATCVRVPLKK